MIKENTLGKWLLLFPCVILIIMQIYILSEDILFDSDIYILNFVYFSYFNKDDRINTQYII